MDWNLLLGGVHERRIGYAWVEFGRLGDDGAAQGTCDGTSIVLAASSPASDPLVTAVGASFGGWAGALMLRRVNEKLLKLAVVALGLALTIGLFWTAP